MRTTLALAALVLCSSALAAPPRTIEVKMTDDMRFAPAKIEVKRGDRIHFKLVNAGKQVHEMVIGTQKELDEQAANNAKYAQGSAKGGSLTHVQPGTTGSLVWTFKQAGELKFACLIPGHYPSVMGTIVVR